MRRGSPPRPPPPPHARSGARSGEARSQQPPSSPELPRCPRPCPAPPGRAGLLGRPAPEGAPEPGEVPGIAAGSLPPVLLSSSRAVLSSNLYFFFFPLYLGTARRHKGPGREQRRGRSAGGAAAERAPGTAKHTPGSTGQGRKRSRNAAPRAPSGVKKFLKVL